MGVARMTAQHYKSSATDRAGIVGLVLLVSWLFDWSDSKLWDLICVTRHRDSVGRPPLIEEL